MKQRGIVKEKMSSNIFVHIMCASAYDSLKDKTEKQNCEMPKLECQTSATEKIIVSPVFVSAAESRANRVEWKGTVVSAKSFLIPPRVVWSAQAEHFYDLSKTTSYRVRLITRWKAPVHLLFVCLTLSVI